MLTRALAFAFLSACRHDASPSTATPADRPPDKARILREAAAEAGIASCPFADEFAAP